MIGKENGRDLVHSVDGIRDLLRRDGIRVIVVADNVPLDFQIQRTLRDLLDTGQFRLKSEVCRQRDSSYGSRSFPGGLRESAGSATHRQISRFENAHLEP